MKRYIIWPILAAVYLASAASLFSAENQFVEFELTVRQKPLIMEKYFEILSDTVQAPVGKKLLTSMANFSLDLRVERADSLAAEFTIHLVTIGQTPFNFASRYRIEYGLPARVENIPGKNGSLYQLLISPRGVKEVQEPSCQYDPDLAGQFNLDPSTNFDIYYVKYSLADYHWNNIKNYLETDYTRFRDIFELGSPGKINLYLCPCPSPTLRWDKRFGYMIDPGRANIYTIYTHDFVSTDAILPNILRLERIWGYAPPFLTEGLAGYLEFSGYEMKKVKKDKTLPDLRTILTSSGYIKADPKLAETMAASFVKFMVDSFGPGKMRRWYESADDLSIYADFSEIYGKPLDSLETDWHNYVDTVSFSRSMIDYYAARAGVIYNFDRQIQYLEEMSRLDRNVKDSVDTWGKLAPLYYQYGRYYEAEKGYRILLQKDRRQAALAYLVLGNLKMIDGKYDAASRILDSVILADSSFGSVHLSQARILAFKGDTLKAIQLAEEHLGGEVSPAAKIEYLLFLGKMRAARGPYQNSTAASQYFSDAAAWAAELSNKSPDDPTNRLRLGLAYLGLKEYDKAEELLELANFIEPRVYFQVEALLALGNLCDLKGEHERASRYYQKVLALPASVFQRDSAQRYLDKPYRD